MRTADGTDGVVHVQLHASRRIQETDVPVIVNSRRVMSLRPGTLSLAQGVVHWPPPPAALEHATTIMQQQQQKQDEMEVHEGSTASLEQQQQMFASDSFVRLWNLSVPP
jgi:hypothetical protein